MAVAAFLSTEGDLNVINRFFVMADLKQKKY